jgi:AraC-like DNA-binding protein
LRSLYIRPGVIPDPPLECRVVAVSPILRELILYASEFSTDYEYGSLEKKILEVILELIQTLDTRPLQLPAPSDCRLLKVTENLIRDPADNRSLEEWGRLCGATGRTLARLFARETGMGFRQWRQQARLLEALRQLAGGEPVSTVAHNLGYESVSAFILMFRKTLGTTPGQYFSDAGY